MTVPQYIISNIVDEESFQGDPLYTFAPRDTNVNRSHFQ